MSQPVFTTPTEIDRIGRRYFALIVPIVLAAICLWMAMPNAVVSRGVGFQPANIQPENLSISVTTPSLRNAIPVSLPSASPKLITRPIEDITPGMRVLASNPDNEGVTVEKLEISEPGKWQLVTFQMVKPDSSSLFIDILQPIDSLTLGESTELSFPELAIEGLAEVTAVKPCPLIETGPGYLVTAKFTHTAANVIDLRIASETEPLGTTSNHPFWSEDQQDWIQAGELHPGEHLRLVDGTLTHVLSITVNPTTQPVFNLTVDAQHTYHVGESGVLVHNSQNYNNAIGKALTWLGSRGFASSRAKPYASRSSSAHSGGRMNGMRDGNGGYRIEYDARNGAHINVFSGREKGPHFNFSGNEADVTAILRQLFGG